MDERWSFKWVSSIHKLSSAKPTRERILERCSISTWLPATTFSLTPLPGHHRHALVLYLSAPKPGLHPITFGLRQFIKQLLLIQESSETDIEMEKHIGSGPHTHLSLYLIQYISFLTRWDSSWFHCWGRYWHRAPQKGVNQSPYELTEQIFSVGYRRLPKICQKGTNEANMIMHTRMQCQKWA